MSKIQLKFIFLFILILLIIVPNFAQEKMRIAVMDFEVEAEGAPEGLGRVVADMLITSLVKTENYKVYEREKLQKVMAEQNLGASGRVDPTTAAKIGKLIGVDTLVYATITEFGIRKKGLDANTIVPDVKGYDIPVNLQIGKKTFRVVIDLRVIDATTGEILTAETVEGFKEKFKIGGGVAGINLGDSGWINTEAGVATRMAIDNIVNIISSNSEQWGEATCIYCGAKINRNAKFCPKCGKAQKEIKLECPNCGATISASDKFCPECGKPVNQNN